VADWTGALEVSFGYDPKDATTGLGWWSDRIHPDDLDDVLTKVARFREAGAPATMALSYLWRRADDKYAAVADRWTALRAPDGTLVKAVVGMVDVTATREVEQQLRQSQKMEAVGQLTGGIAHDFNNLLGIVIGNLDILSDLDPVKSDPLAATLTDEALRGALRGAELNRRLLAFARRQSLSPEVVAVDRTLEGVAEILRRSLGERINVEIRLDDGLWPIRVDASQFDAALLNLAVNARDAMPDGGDLTIEARNATFDAEYADAAIDVRPGDYVAISVADTRTGMTPEVLGRVFEPFFTTKEVGRGTGLGLSMVHGFVKQSGGHVTIYSEIGRGTVVRLYLPHATIAGPHKETGALPAAEGGGGERILVVEDNPILRGVVVRLLTSLGYRITETGDATEAMRMLEDGIAIDLLFTDVVIPGPMDGIELARRARRLRPGLKVLLTSGFTERAAARTNGHAADHGPLPPLLSKPYRKAELATTVAAILAARDRTEGDA
jgi:signal transduction histidine kinase